MPVFNVSYFQNPVTQERLDGTWWPARPVDGPWWWRVKAAWGVLCGRYDALDWTKR